jgi:hypothetical protein
MRSRGSVRSVGKKMGLSLTSVKGEDGGRIDSLKA